MYEHGSVWHLYADSGSCLIADLQVKRWDSSKALVEIETSSFFFFFFLDVLIETIETAAMLLNVILNVKPSFALF